MKRGCFSTIANFRRSGLGCKHGWRSSWHWLVDLQHQCDVNEVAVVEEGLQVLVGVHHVLVGVHHVAASKSLVAIVEIACRDRLAHQVKTMGQLIVLGDMWMWQVCLLFAPAC